MVAIAVNMKLLYFHSPRANAHAPSFSSLLTNTTITSSHGFPNNLSLHSGQSHPNPTVVTKAALDKDSLVPSDEAEDGVLLGTMKLPDDTDFPRFQILLFQWANSLCQGANLPLDMPLKVDKIAGGTRLGFITIGDGETEVIGYIDCLVFPLEGGSGPIFRAVRNGRLKDRVLPGEPRIMRNLMVALQQFKSLECNSVHKFVHHISVVVISHFDRYMLLEDMGCVNTAHRSSNIFYILVNQLP